jgi:uroporphyrinogen-III decarboxylase
VLRNDTPQAVRDGLAECHRQAGEAYIVGAGCEVVRDSPHENVRAMCDYARTNA